MVLNLEGVVVVPPAYQVYSYQTLLGVGVGALPWGCILAVQGEVVGVVLHHLALEAELVAMEACCLEEAVLVAMVMMTYWEEVAVHLVLKIKINSY
jgi:hypothetical protein